VSRRPVWHPGIWLVLCGILPGALLWLVIILLLRAGF